MTTEILPINKKSLSIAKQILLSGGLVGFPTETVYGLGASSFDGEAVKKIYEVKNRPIDNPLISHVHKDYDLNKIAIIEQDYVSILLKKLTPGPITFVFKSNGAVAKEVTAGGDTVAVRIPEHKGAQKFLKYMDFPIAAPSANLSKHTSPVTAMHVYDDLNGKIPLILDGGRSYGGIESTVLDVTGPIPRILRPGLITSEDIKNLVGDCEYAGIVPDGKIMSPGTKYSHYKPNVKVIGYFNNDLQKAINDYEQCLKDNLLPYIMCSDDVAKKLQGKNVLNIGKTAQEMSSNLYYKLREAETLCDLLIIIMPERLNDAYVGVINRLEKVIK